LSWERHCALACASRANCGGHRRAVFLIAATGLSEFLIDDSNRQSPGVIGLYHIRQLEQFSLGRLGRRERAILLESHLGCIAMPDGVGKALLALRDSRHCHPYRRGKPLNFKAPPKIRREGAAIFFPLNYKISIRTQRHAFSCKDGKLGRLDLTDSD
jgi:hypothetical protein